MNDAARAGSALVTTGLACTITEPGSRTPRTLLRSVDLTIQPGEVVGLTGASGSGKSTLIRLLSGLQKPDGGEVRLGTDPVVDIRTRAGQATAGRIGVVFQAPRSAMNPFQTLQGSIDVAAAQAARRRSSGRRVGTEVDLRALATQIGLRSDVLGRRPAHVSDGQLQRAAILRTLAHRPETVLCDEITASLDPIASASVMRAMQHIAHDLGCGVLVVSHDHGLVEAIADRVLTLSQLERHAA